MLLSSAYLPPVQWFAHLKSAGEGAEVWVEQCESYTKQTWRNRCLIATADGVQALTVPVVSAEGHQLMRDVRISDHGQWRHLHWNALEAAYRHTPFFDYYEDDFRPFYEQPYEFLFDFNMRLTELVCRLIDLHPALRPTEEYVPEGQAGPEDYRALISPKQDWHTADPAFQPRPYYQVFAARHGFQPNLSVVDLLFNMGPESLLVL